VGANDPLKGTLDIMERQPLYSRLAISLILILQVIPLLLFPPQIYGSGSQQWLLPAVLTFMVVVADINVFLRGGGEIWPWLLISFVQGVNIISRLMMLWAQSSTATNGVTTFDWAYILAAIVSMAMSGFMLWYTEKPAVREGMLRA